MNKRGSILLHVLVTGALIALIAATLMRMAMLRYTVTAHATVQTQERRQAEGALNLIIGAWNSANTACRDNVPYYSCTPNSTTPPGVCTCVCTPTGGAPAYYPKVVASGVAPSCTLKIGGNQSDDIEYQRDHW